MHLLPTPISSFTVVADGEAAAARLTHVPLLATLAARMQCRIDRRIGIEGAPPPGLPVLASRPGATDEAMDYLQRGATQLLVLPDDAAPPSRIVILPGERARAVALAVSASLLRHFPAQSVLLAVHPAATPERERGACLRQLLDVRSAALAEHGLDLRTEIRFGELDEEVGRELSLAPDTLVVIGVDSAADGIPQGLARQLEGGRARAVMFVRAAAERCAWHAAGSARRARFRASG
jgi:sulfate transport system ATP-binding protein